MLSKALIKKINEQLNYEFYSEHLYIAMIGYFEDQDLPGFANYFRVQVQEERFHAMRFFDYLVERDARVDITSIPEVENKYGSILSAFKKTYEHEQSITERIYKLMDAATKEGEYATISFLKWFIDEQMEEEATAKSVVKKLERIGDDVNALYTLDNELALRVFTPPAVV